MRVTAKADYALRAAVELAEDIHGYRRVESIAQAQDIPAKFLQTILADLRRAGIVLSRRGVDGGYRLARPAHAISVADVLQVTDGPLTVVRGAVPLQLPYPDITTPLGELWATLWASMQGVLKSVTLADLVATKDPAASEVPGGDPITSPGQGASSIRTAASTTHARPHSVH